MADVPTANYGWIKPDVGGSDDSWGGKLNTDLDGIDTTVKSVSTVASAAYPASNPSSFVNAAGAASAAPVQSVATRTGAVTLTHIDITDWTTTLAPYAPLASPALTGNPTAPTPTLGDNDTSVATTAFVTAALPAASSTPPVMDGVQAIGVGTTWARADHVHASDTTRLAVQGVTNGSDASAGQVGEVISSVIAGPGTTLSTGVPINITSIALTAGDWDVTGDVWVVVGTGAATLVQGAINSVSANPPAIALGVSRTQLTTTFAASTAMVVPLSPCRVSLTATTTYYLIAAVTFPSGTTTAYGKIWARRAR